MEQLDLAIKYLNKRAISTEKVKSKFMKQFISVIPASEVETVLEMVKTGTFLSFYNAMKEKGFPDFI